MTVATLTKVQADTLAFIKSFQADNGFAPSYEEIKEAMGWASKSAVHRHISALIERGYLKRNATRRARCFVFSDPEERKAEILLSEARFYCPDYLRENIDDYLMKQAEGVKAA